MFDHQIDENIMLGKNMSIKHVKFIIKALGLSNDEIIKGAFYGKTDAFNKAGTNILLVSNIRIILFLYKKNTEYDFIEINIGNISNISSNPDSGINKTQDDYNPNIFLVIQGSELSFRLLKSEVKNAISLMENIRSELTRDQRQIVIKTDSDIDKRYILEKKLSILGYLKERRFIKAISSIILVGFAIIFTYSIYFYYFTEEGRLTMRFHSYDEAFKAYDVDTAFSHLTPYSKKMVDKGKWEKKVLTWNTGRTDSISTIRFNDEKTQAKVGVEVEDKGEIIARFAYTWKLIDGEWYRAYYEDNNQSTNDKKDLVNAISFKIEEYEYSWDIDSSLLSSSKLYRPEIKFRVRNIGEFPIKYLRFKVQFHEKKKSKIFSNVDDYAISSSDIPLGVGILSETYFLKSSIGLDIKKLLMKSVLNESDSDVYIRALKQYAKDIYPVLHYKSDSSSDWMEYDLK